MADIELSTAPAYDGVETYPKQGDFYFPGVKDGAVVKLTAQQLADIASAAAGGVRLLNPAQFSAETPEFPVDANGRPYADPRNTASLAAMPDYSDEWDRTFYEACKLKQPATIVLGGAWKTTRTVYTPPGAAMSSQSRTAVGIFYDGAAGGLFFAAGDYYVPQVALPIASSTVVGGNRVYTIAVPNGTTAVARQRDLEDNVVPSNTGWRALAATIDPFGDWLGMYRATTVSSNTAGGAPTQARADIQAVNATARTITVTGDPGGSPSHLLFPPLCGTAGAHLGKYLSSNTVDSPTGPDSHPLYKYEKLSDFALFCQHKGVVAVVHKRGVKGRDDPALRLPSFVVNRPYDLRTSIDSDSSMGGWSVGQPREGSSVELSSVDSVWGDMIIAATQRDDIKMGSALSGGGMSQSTATGWWKFYYLSQTATTRAMARSVSAAAIAKWQGFAHVGKWEIEDQCGSVFFWPGRTTDIKIRNFKGNNLGAVGLGAPGSIGSKPWWDADVVEIPTDASVTDCSLEGVIRSNRGNRDGWHARSALWLCGSGPNTGWAPADSRGGVSGCPHMLRNVLIQLDCVEGDTRGMPANELPASAPNRGEYSAGATYAAGDMVYAPGRTNPWDVRWRAKDSYASGAHSAPPAPPNDHVAGGNTWWAYRGGDRTAWRQGFILGLDADTVLDEGQYAHEFWGVRIIINGRRDPSYHQRILSPRAQFCLDPEADIAQINMSGRAADTTLDVFRGSCGREQIIRALNLGAGGNVVFTPGGRATFGYGDSATLATTSAGGLSATLRRSGSELRFRHNGDGTITFLPHDQVETVPNANLALGLSDYGKTLIVPASTARTVTAPAAASVPAGWYCTVQLSGTGSLAFSGVTGVGGLDDITTQYRAAVLQKVGSVIVMHGGQ